MSEPVAAALARVRDRIERAMRSAGRSDPVLLVGATKGVAPERIAEAAAAGLTDAGENRVQELLRKQRALEGTRLRWHFIGSVQRNKIRDLAGRVGLIHGIDAVSLAAAVGRRAAAAGSVQDVLLQVNTSAEPAKHGVAPGEAAEVALAVADVPGVRLRGLMTIGPLGGDPRPAFRSLAALRDRIAAALPGVTELSMGMSGDLEAAVEEGATIVRVGTAIFGERTR